MGTQNLLSLREKEHLKNKRSKRGRRKKEMRIATRDPMTGPENAPSVLGFNTSAAKNSGGGKRPKPLQIPYSILLQEFNFFQLVGPCPTERPGRPQKTAPPVMGFSTSRRHGRNAKAKTPNPPTPLAGPGRLPAGQPESHHQNTAGQPRDSSKTTVAQTAGHRFFQPSWVRGFVPRPPGTQ